MNHRIMESLLLCALALAVSALPAAAAPVLGPAQDFNVFMLGTISLSNSDTEGRMAAGGAVSLTNYGVGSLLPNSSGTRDDLIVDGTLTYTNGQVFGGNVVYGGMLSATGLGVPNGTVRQESGVIDFVAAGVSLQAISNAYGAIPANGAYASSYGVTLTGSDPSLNVFDITTAQLAAANNFGLSLNVPAGSATLINVRGGAVSLANFGFSGFDANNVLFNFPDLGSLTMTSIGPEGSILAPQATVAFNYGQMNGTLAAVNLSGTGEFHDWPLTGNIPEPATLALLVTGGAAVMLRRR